MNFNLNFRVDKALEKLSESKALSIWTYIIAGVVVVGIMIWQAAPILTAVAKIIEVLKK